MVKEVGEKHIVAQDEKKNLLKCVFPQVPAPCHG